MLDVVAFHDAPLAIAQRHARADLACGPAARRATRRLARPRRARGHADRARRRRRRRREVALAGLDGVDLRVGVDPDLPTGTCVVLVAPGGERTMLPDPGANDALRRRAPTTCSTRATPARLRLLADAPRLARGRAGRDRHGARRGDADQRRPGHRRAAGRRSRVPRPRAPVDLLLPNEDEAAALGAADLRRAASS